MSLLTTFWLVAKGFTVSYLQDMAETMSCITISKIYTIFNCLQKENPINCNCKQHPSKKLKVKLSDVEHIVDIILSSKEAQNTLTAHVNHKL